MCISGFLVNSKFVLVELIRKNFLVTLKDMIHCTPTSQYPFFFLPSFLFFVVLSNCNINEQICLGLVLIPRVHLTVSHLCVFTHTVSALWNALSAFLYLASFKLFFKPQHKSLFQEISSEPSGITLPFLRISRAVYTLLFSPYHILWKCSVRVAVSLVKLYCFRSHLCHVLTRVISRPVTHPPPLAQSLV